MQRLEVSGAVRHIYRSLGVKGVKKTAAHPKYSCRTRICAFLLFKFIQIYCYFYKAK